MKLTTFTDDSPRVLMSRPFPYDGPEALREPIAAALRRVVDPELAMTIVDVGLVLGVEVRDGRVAVRMTMTSAACPVIEVILEDAHAELARVLPVSLAVAIDLVWEPPWTPRCMSERARRIMGW